MGRMACHTFRPGVLSLPVFPAELAMARPAVDDGLDFLLFEMAGVAGHRHHGRRRVDLVTGNTVQGRAVACPVAEIT